MYEDYSSVEPPKPPPRKKKSKEEEPMFTSGEWAFIVAMLFALVLIIAGCCQNK
jgi:flagellar biogenesis protein FliO